MIRWPIAFALAALLCTIGVFVLSLRIGVHDGPAAFHRHGAAQAHRLLSRGMSCWLPPENEFFADSPSGAIASPVFLSARDGDLFKQLGARFWSGDDDVVRTYLNPRATYDGLWAPTRREFTFVAAFERPSGLIQNPPSTYKIAILDVINQRHQWDPRWYPGGYVAAAHSPTGRHVDRLPGGVVTNAIDLALALAILASGAFSIHAFRKAVIAHREHARIRKDRCPACAHELQQWQTQCPECGGMIKIGGA